MTLSWGDLAAIITAVAAVGVPAIAGIRRMRTNDLKHLDEKLKLTYDVVVRTEDKIDRHLEWHAEK